MAQAIKLDKKPKALKVGIVPCNGEEICEGTLTRFACRKVLDELRPGQTVTLCLPLFIAGDEKERNFANRFPTITVDGCEKRCSQISTEKLSGKPAYSLVVSDVLQKHGISLSDTRRVLTDEGQEAVNVLAQEIAKRVDEILAG
ncbi:MAG: putative zinc-binding protein [Syntrophothermus sp.]|uniref:putative zinc-binding protein n=1 Tax=Syntrophothermus sp. TaxID=2736299 RepID=UPI002580F74D|nr:putative zinc-binding protein [Syntrophothermus sp.]NSW82645.1 putative zinc-binding protein [Syntrophothermus sp.]